MFWTSISVDRLLAAQDDAGGWAYHDGSHPCAEPTALACLALSFRAEHTREAYRGADWLARIQRANGAVPVSETVNNAFWPTSLAMLAWHRLSSGRPDYERSHIARGTAWLLQLKGETYPPAPAIFGHDLGLVGWPWVGGTHSWIEPTAYAVRALCKSNICTHRRVQEGIELILDRTLPEGGWNYGNTRVLANTLRPFPATTGIALWGLAGVADDQRIARSIEYLKEAVRRIRAPWSLSWCLIGLSAWNVDVPDSSEFLADSAARLDGRERNVMDDALMLLANALISQVDKNQNES